MSETIREQGSSDLYTKDMVKYLIIVNRRRAFPEIRDGLKPVQRRVIYDMFDQGATSYSKRIKCTAIVGDTMKKFHAHGDSSLYSCLEPMANWYKTKVPLVAPKGNFGTVMGDDPAAPRYTEAGLSDFCFDCIIGELKDSKGVVDWIDTYDRKTVEPEYLPVKLPILLINGSFGIGVGMNTNIPTHNLIEVCEATRELIKNPKADIVLIPDHCQPCKIIGDKKEFRKISHTGMGKYKIRGEVTIGEEKGYPMLYITSLPDNISTASIVDKLNDMIANKELPMIKDVIDASTSMQQHPVDIRIQLRKGSDPYYVKQVLYAKTQVQTSVSVNFEVVKGTDPGRFSYKDYLLDFIQERSMTKFRLYCNKLKDATTRYHRLIAYIKLIESGEIDNVIKMIKKQTKIDDNFLVEYLIKKINVTDLQAKFILDTDIRRLSKGYLEKYKAEFKELEKAMKSYRDAITDDGSIIMKEIDQELLDIEKKYGSPRICKVISDADDNNIPKGTFKVVVTRNNYIRKIPDTDRVGVVRGDDPKFIIKVDNAENILLYKIPVTDRQSNGTDVRILCKNLTADIIAVYYEPIIKQIVEGNRKHYITVVSKLNTIKKLDMEDFINVSVSGLMYSKIRDDDEITGITIAPADLDVVVFSKQKALRTSMKNIPLFKRNATGSKAMATNEEIEGVSVIYPNAEFITVVTTKGKINKFPISGFASHNRARAGINVIKLQSGDSIKAIYGANDSDMIRIVTSSAVVEVPVNSIKSRSSVAAGDNIPLKGANIVRCDLMWNK